MRQPKLREYFFPSRVGQLIDAVNDYTESLFFGFGVAEIVLIDLIRSHVKPILEKSSDLLFVYLDFLIDAKSDSEFDHDVVKNFWIYLVNGGKVRDEDLGLGGVSFVMINDLAHESLFAFIFFWLDEKGQGFFLAFNELFDLLKLLHVLHGKNVVDFCLINILIVRVFLLPKIGYGFW